MTELPPELDQALGAHEQAGIAFDALPPERQAEWARYVERARSRRGRSRRVQEAIRRLGGWTPTLAAASEETVERRPRPAPPPPREWWPWLLLLALLIIAALLAWFFATRGGTEKRTVPRVVGLQEAAAVRRLNDRGLTARVSRRPSDAPRGSVFGQDPPAGTKLSKGDRVHLAVSNAPVLILVPDVRGLSADDADRALVSAGLVPNERGVFSKKKPGLVIAQTPTPGTKVKKTSTVTVDVSRGRGKTTVPALVGVTQTVAVARLRKAELTPKVAQVPSAQPKGTVVAQAPPPTKRVVKGTRVRINVSTGAGAPTTTTTNTTTTATTVATTTVARTTTTAPRTTTVPDVTGQDHTQAVKQLLAAHLRPKVVYVRSDQPDNTVVDQTPAAGTSLRRGSVVRIDVSAGPSPTYTTVPGVVGQTGRTARRTLQQAGFTVAIFRVPGRSGIVVRQQPAGGNKAPQGGQVDIFVGTG